MHDYGTCIRDDFSLDYSGTYMLSQDSRGDDQHAKEMINKLRK